MKSRRPKDSDELEVIDSQEIYDNSNPTGGAVLCPQLEIASDSHSSSANKSARELERRTVYSASYSLRPQLFFDDQLILCEFKNITFSGACIVIKSPLPPLKNKGNKLRINIKQGESFFCHDINFRVAWEDRNFGHLLGVEFTKSDLPYNRKRDRYLTDPNFRPTFLFKDPLEPSRSIYGTVTDILLDGFSLITSITNKHLFVGMKTTGILNTIENTQEVSARIQNISIEGDDIRVGISVKSTLDYIKVLKSYLATFCFEFPLDNQSMAKNIGDAISFFGVEDDIQYQKVVQLRYDAYAGKDKLNDQARKSLNPGLEMKGSSLLVS